MLIYFSSIIVLERRMMYILFYINRIPPAHSFSVFFSPLPFTFFTSTINFIKNGKLPSLGMPIEPKIMDGFDTWGYGGGV